MTSSMYGLLSKAPYGVYAVDMSQTILFWNRSAERILGHTAEEAVGLRCYEVLQSLPESGTVPVCLQGCPAIRLAREGRVPSVVNVAARCASGARKHITVAPLIIEMDEQRVRVHLFHEQINDAKAKMVAGRVLSVLSSEMTPWAAPTDSTTDLASGDQVKPLSIREVEVLRLLSLGLETGQIAGELNLSSYTVLNHIRNARRKLRSQNRLGAILAALRLRLI